MSQDSQATQPMDSSESSTTDVKDPVPSSSSVGGGGGGGGGAVAADADADMDGSQAPIDHALWEHDHRKEPEFTSIVVPLAQFHFSSGITGAYRRFGFELRARFLTRRGDMSFWGEEKGGSADENKKGTAVSKKRKGEHKESVQSKRSTSDDRSARSVVRPVLSRSFNPRGSGTPEMSFAQICNEYDNKEIVLARRQIKRLARVAEIGGRGKVHAGVTDTGYSGKGMQLQFVDANSFLAPTPFIVEDETKSSRFAREALRALHEAGNPHGGPGIWDLLFYNIIIQYAPFGLISNPSPAYCIRALATHGLIVTDLEMFIEAYRGMMCYAVEPTDQSITNFVCPGCLSFNVGLHLSDCPIKCLCINPVTVLSRMKAQVAVLDNTWDLYMHADNIVTWLYAFYIDLCNGRFS